IVGSIFLEGKNKMAALHGNIVVSLLGTSATTQTAADGSFRLDDIAAGTYTLSASKADATVTYEAATQILVVRGGLTTTAQELVVAIARGSVAGAARILGETDHSGVTVTLVGTTYTGITNADGDFAIAGVPVGSYDVQA